MRRRMVWFSAACSALFACTSRSTTDAGDTGSRDDVSLADTGPREDTATVDGDAATDATRDDAAGPDASTVVGELGPSAAICTPPTRPATTLCEATGGARCFYLDATRGHDDTGDGSFDRPWRSFANVVTYYGTPGENGSTPSPANAVTLRAGDHVYLMSGTYGDVYNYNGSPVVAFFRGITAGGSNPIHIAAYPGESPVIDAGARAIGLHILQSSGFVVEGLEVRNAMTRGILVEEDDAVTLTRVHVHDTDGVDNDNVSGVYVLGSTHVEVACSTIHDNYDRTNADTGGEATANSTNMVAFTGGDVHVHHDLFYQSPAITAPRTGACLKYKHAAAVPDGVFEVDHNVFRQCRFLAIGTGTQHSYVHHNLVRDGAGIVSEDFAGPTQQLDQRFEHNTFYLADGFHLDPTPDYDPPRGIAFRANVVFESRTVADQENGTIVIGTYGSDALYDLTIPELTFDANCYWNTAGSAWFDLFAANGGSYGTEGAGYSLHDWQAQGFDVSSVEANPGFVDPAHDDFHTDPSGPCASQGAFVP